MISKFAIPFAVLVAGMTMAGCASQQGSGDPAVDELLAGHYPQANQMFSDRLAKNPDDFLAQFNLADTMRLQGGQNDAAIALYRKVAVSGRGFHPRKIYENHGQDETLADVACNHLKAMGATDPNCP